MIAALVLSLSLAQLTPEQLAKVNRDRNDANVGAMWVLTGWSTGNLVVGLDGFFSTDDPEWKAFHAANFVWNLVNLPFGINGLVQGYAPPAQLDLAASREASQGSQIFALVNGGLDLVYLTAGAIMLWQGHVQQSPILKGFGKAALLQGAFLLLFDLSLFIMNSTMGAPLRAGTDRAF